VKVVLSWLREFCATDLGDEELAELLTAQGVKVEAVLRPWEGLAGVVVARVVEVRDHPNSDTLCLARVNMGAGEREVVVGVRNMRPGDLVPLAAPGASVPTLADPLGERKIRGVLSQGMLCSPRELAVSPNHEGILVLPADAPIGADVKEVLGLDDSVLDIEVKSNRPDLLSVAGVAREAAAATGVAFHQADCRVPESGEKAEEAATVQVMDVERCPRYLARVIRGVSAAPSPLRVQTRLTASGMRPVSAAVDATNYVMLEMGQPMHPFDLDLLAGGEILVRRATEGESLVTLDGVGRILSEDDLVIADREKAVAIGGVIGSAEAEVGSSTANVLLESAHFQPAGVLRTSRRLGVSTEASVRFSRGADPESVDLAAARAARLMAEWCGGAVLSGAADVGTVPDRRRVSVRPSRAARVLGYTVDEEQVEGSLHRLAMSTERAADGVVAEIPGYRQDLHIEEDLIEEVARLLGYDRVPETVPQVRQPGGVAPEYALRRRVREALVRAGLREALSFSFASDDDLSLMLVGADRAVRVANPLAADQAFLRTSLVPGLIRAVRHNLARQVEGAALFEVGRVFCRGDDVEEEERVAAAVAGQASAGYPEPSRSFGFLDAKGVLETLMDSLAVDEWTFGRPPGGPLHPGRSASVVVGGEVAGMIGELHPKVAGRLDLPAGTAALELRTSALAAGSSTVVYRAVPRFPPLRRDLAFTVPDDVPAEEIRTAILSASDGMADRAVLFDVFTGGPVPPGKRSLAFSVDFRASDRTLTDQDVEGITGVIQDRLRREFGAELRTG
jgi:phenylalanyl-tRNA synthetase beta chain